MCCIPNTSPSFTGLSTSFSPHRQNISGNVNTWGRLCGAALSVGMWVCIDVYGHVGTWKCKCVCMCVSLRICCVYRLSKHISFHLRCGIAELPPSVSVLCSTSSHSFSTIGRPCLIYRQEIKVDSYRKEKKSSLCTVVFLPSLHY